MFTSKLTFNTDFHEAWYEGILGTKDKLRKYKDIFYLVRFKIVAVHLIIYFVVVYFFLFCTEVFNLWKGVLNFNEEL